MIEESFKTIMELTDFEKYSLFKSIYMNLESLFGSKGDFLLPLTEKELLFLKALMGIYTHHLKEKDRQEKHEKYMKNFKGHI